jgi:lactate permease
MSIEDISIWMWLAAVAPLAVILYLLIGRHWKADTAAPVGYFLAALIAAILFQASDRTIALLTVMGIWDALFILYVVVPALLLYQVSKEAGTFDVLRRALQDYTPNDLLHVLAFGWVFSSFLQGITGFGAPAAVTAPLMVAIGVRPVWAVVIALTGHAWANTFGTLAVAWEGLVAVTSIDAAGSTAAIAALMLMLANLLAGLSITWLFGRMTAIREALPALTTVSIIHGGGQLILAPIVPTLANFLPGTLALVAILLLARTRWYQRPTEIVSPIMTEDPAEQPHLELDEESSLVSGSERHEMPLWLAMLPYLVLIVLIISVRLIPPVNSALSEFRLGLAFPRLETGRGVVTEATDAYRSFAPLTHPGTFLLAATLVAYIVFNRRGDIAPGRMRSLLAATTRASIPSAVALFTLIPLAVVMEGSGQTLALALGIAAVAPGPVYMVLAPLVGLLGSFMTSSNLSSNILFGPLQESLAVALNLPLETVLAGQTAGAAVGNTIAPGNVLLGAGAVGIPEQAGRIIRHGLPYVLGSLVLIGAVSLINLFLMGGR